LLITAIEIFVMFILFFCYYLCSADADEIIPLN